MEQIDVNRLRSKRRIINKYNSLGIYGICSYPLTHEQSLDEALHRKKIRNEYWDNIAKIAKELDLKQTEPDHSKNLKLKKKTVILTNQFSTKWWKNTIKDYHKQQYIKEVEKLPVY